MAACKKCNKAVGCGCNLSKDGLCATCAQEKRKQEEETLKNKKPPTIPLLH